MVMKAYFPDADTPEEFQSVRRDEARLRPGVLAIRERLGLGSAEVERFPDGSLPVYRVGATRVLKLYPPCYFSERDREWRVMQVLDGRLPIATPGIEAVGELEGWGYVLMQFLPGRISSEVWQDLGREDRMRLGASLGEALAALHAICDPRLEAFRTDWPAFLAAQRRGCVARQRGLRLADAWLEQIPAFLEETDLGSGSAESLLHTEIMREHLLIERGSGGWAFSGLIDFEPAMVGAPEYEFASVGLFFSCTDAPLLRSVLLGYGLGEVRMDEALQRRFLAYGLLHRYSNVPWYLERLPPPAGARTLEDLAAWWWRLEGS